MNMPYKLMTGNIFDTKLDIIVNTVNCVGVMGAGLALEFKKRFPDYFRGYQILCREKKLKLGFPWIHPPKDGVPWIISFPTKGHWKEKSILSNIEAGLVQLHSIFNQNIGDWTRVKGIAFPLLGCRNGGLDQKDVIPLIDKYMGHIGFEIEIWTKP